MVYFGSDVDATSLVHFPFFPGILFCRTPRKTRETDPAFEKNDG